MSLQQTLPGASWQGKLIEPGFLERQGELRAKLLALLASAKYNRRRVLLLLAAFFVLGLGAFMLSLLRVAPTSTTVPAVVTSKGVARPLELHIADNGLILLRSARIAAISGTTITLSTAWGETQFTWVVETDAGHYGTREFGTKFLTRDGQASSINDLAVGDLVTVTGGLQSTASSPTLIADTVRLSQ